MNVSFTFALAMVAAIAAMPPATAEEDDWRNDPKILTCSPRILKKGGAVTLLLGARHGAEMALRRTGSRDWYFVVTGDGEQQPMTAPAFKAAKRFTLNEASTGAADSGRRERIFSRPGRYTVYVSDKLESEAGGNICTIDYRP